MKPTTRAVVNVITNLSGFIVVSLSISYSDHEAAVVFLSGVSVSVIKSRKINAIEEMRRGTKAPYIYNCYKLISALETKNRITQLKVTQEISFPATGVCEVEMVGRSRLGQKFETLTKIKNVNFHPLCPAKPRTLHFVAVN